MSTKQLIAGNWKMNGTLEESIVRVKELIEATKSSSNVDVLICPPFQLLSSLSNLLKNSNIKLGAQDCHFSEKGAFTGNISANMLKDVGCRYVILGHSERRAYNGETDGLIKQKIEAAINANLIPIFCIGETKDQKESGKTFSIIESQLKNAFPDNFKGNNLIIAYEPVWAIGTGLVASSDDITNTHKFIKEIIANLSNSVSASKVKVLYGGSLNAKNCTEILPLTNVDGGLIGGASLVVKDFVTIINAANEIK